MSTTAARIELPAGVRLIRRLTPPEAPWPASLIRTGDASRMLVDAALLVEWDGWDAAAGGHVLGPLDVLRRADGHDVLLPLCTERVEALLARRGAGLPLTPGEIVTLAVSVLRGIVEIARREVDAAKGTWWLTDDGRPVFVDESDGPPAGRSTADLLERVAMDAPAELGAALRDAAGGVREPRRLAHEIDDVEQRLFEAAAPEPLATAPLASGRLRQASEKRAAKAEEAEGGSRSWGAALLASVDTDLADAFSRATTGLWRRMRRPVSPHRRRPWALAGCLGAGVIAVGLMWPSPGGPAVAGAGMPTPSTSPGSNAPTPDPSSAPAPPSAAPEGVATPEDLTAVAAALLEKRRECLTRDDDACLADVVEDPSRALPPGAVDAVAEERALTLLDDFGGVAVLRAETTTGAPSEQLVIITDSDGRWLLRDVHDVVAQP